LEQKKPQLDDLVKTAENLRESPIRQQIPEKGKKKKTNPVSEFLGAIHKLFNNIY
jgi:hypothetical protein